MRDIPIIFSGPMVRALLDGRKTMTRRLAWKEVHRLDIADPADVYTANDRGWEIAWGRVFDGGSGSVAEPCAALAGFPSPWQRVKLGDRLWVRENLHKRTEHPHRGEWEWSATDYPIAIHRDDPRVSAMIAWAHHKEGDSAPSIHMPRWASRLTLIVTATKIEWLKDISADDAKAEGIDGPCPMTGVFAPQLQFAQLWVSLHGPGSFDTNPEVVALTFTVHKQNIDTLPKAEAA